MVLGLGFLDLESNAVPIEFICEFGGTNLAKGELGSEHLSCQVFCVWLKPAAHVGIGVDSERYAVGDIEAGSTPRILDPA